MAAMQELSKFYSDDEKRTATVYKVLGESELMFASSVKNSSGSTFVAYFGSLTDAEDFSEDWVMTNE